MLAAAAFLAGPPALGQQQVRPYQGEIVVTAEGRVVSPWVESEACSKKTGACKIMIHNPKTNEIAQLGDKLSSRFELTGNGREVRRAETAVAKSKRLAAR